MNWCQIHQAGNDDEARQIVIEAGSEMREAQLEAGQSLDKNEVLVTSSEKVPGNNLVLNMFKSIASRVSTIFGQHVLYSSYNQSRL